MIKHQAKQLYLPIVNYYILTFRKIKLKLTHSNNFSDAILAALIVPRLGTHFTTRFGSARMGEWILISLTSRSKYIKQC